MTTKIALVIAVLAVAGATTALARHGPESTAYRPAAARARALSPRRVPAPFLVILCAALESDRIPEGVELGFQ
jgi:Mn2+/Fe2+ NRAMP family transporter